MLTLSGSSSNVAGAVAEVATVVATQTVTVVVGKDIARCVVLKLESVTDTLKDSGARLGSVKGDTVTVEGTPEQVEALHSVLQTLDVTSDAVGCEVRDLGVVIGPKGATIKRLEGMGVKVEVVKGEEPGVLLLGRREDVERVRGEVEGERRNAQTHTVSGSGQ